MSIYFRIEESNFKLEKTDLKYLLKDIEEENKKQNWGIKEFENLKSINTIFDYIGIKIVNNDLENIIELDEEEFGDTYKVYNLEEILKVIAKYITKGCYIQVYYAEYGEREKWVFGSRNLKVIEEKRTWEDEDDDYEEEFDKCCKADIEDENDMLDLFIDFFRHIKGYDTWEDDEILGSVNNDDIRDYLVYIQEITQKITGQKQLDMIKDRKDINFN